MTYTCESLIITLANIKFTLLFYIIFARIVVLMVDVIDRIHNWETDIYNGKIDRTSPSRVVDGRVIVM